MRLFISYAHADIRKVERLAEILERAGHEVWFDQAIPGGDDWWQTILTNIEAADVFIFALSPPATRSEACRAEYQYALDLHKPILPVMLAEAELPVGHLQATQYVNAKTLSNQDTVLEIARALFTISERLDEYHPPNPLPPRPKFPFPVDPLQEARTRIEGIRGASSDELLQLVVGLKQIARQNAHTVGEARKLLEQIGRSPYVSQMVATEAKDAAKAIGKGAGIGSRGLMAVGIVVLLAMVGVIVALLFNNGGDDGKEAGSGNRTVTPTDVQTEEPTEAVTEVMAPADTATNTPTRSPTHTPTKTPTRRPTATPTTPQVSGELTIWVSGGTAMIDLLSLWVEMYTANHPDVTLIWEVIDPSDLPAMVATAVAGGAGPDLILTGTDWMGSWADNGYILPIEAMLPYADLPINQISDAAWNTVTRNGQRYGVPITLNTLVLYYNRDLITDADVPTTFGEYSAYAANTQERILVSSTFFFTMGLYFGLGGQLFDENGQNLWNTDEHAAEFLAMLADFASAYPSPDSLDDYDIADFENGETAMLVDGSWNWLNYHEKLGSDLGVTRLPALDNGAAWLAPVISTALFVTDGNPDKLPLVADFLSFAISFEAQTALANDGWMIPANVETPNLDDPAATVFIEQVINGIALPDSLLMDRYWEALATAISSVTMGTDPHEAADTAEQQILEEMGTD